MRKAPVCFYDDGLLKLLRTLPRLVQVVGRLQINAANKTLTLNMKGINL